MARWESIGGASGYRLDVSITGSFTSYVSGYHDLESAIVRNLTPGNYTAIVRGVNSTTGVALVETYQLQ